MEHHNTPDVNILPTVRAVNPMATLLARVKRTSRPCLGVVVHGSWRVFLVLCLLLGHSGFDVPTVAAQSVPASRVEGWADWETLNGAFYTQGVTTADPTRGFAVTDDGGKAFWKAYVSLGGRETLGAPISRRFESHGFTVQVMQRAVLQWRPEAGTAVPTNLFDDLSEAGLDEWLETTRGIPPPVVALGDVGAPPDEILSRRVRWLDAYPTLRRAYLNDADPLEASGLPVAPVFDNGKALVLRTQRRVFLQWKVSTAFARAGQVSLLSGGEVAKQAGLFPEEAFETEDAYDHIAAPLRRGASASDATVAAWRATLRAVRPSVVEVTDGRTGRGTGVIVDVDSGGAIVITNNHVVDAVNRDTLVGRLADGREVPATVVGADDWTDIAVIRLNGASDVAVIKRGAPIPSGTQVMAVGFGSVFPSMPSAKVGMVRGLGGTIQTLHDYPLSGLIEHDVLLSPGDSGGPLVSTQGLLVGIDCAIRFTRVPRRGQEMTAFSIPIAQAWAIASQLRAAGRVPRPALGVSVVDLDAFAAMASGLPLVAGALVRDVPQGGPAAKVGIMVGMVIVGLDGQPVTSVTDLRRLLVSHKIGDVVRVTVIARGGVRQTIALTLADRAGT
jgi:S1-C subfamily serine protease